MADLLSDILVVTCFLNGRQNELTIDNVPVACETNRAVASVLTLFFTALAGLGASGGRPFFVRLQAGHFVNANGANVLLRTLLKLDETEFTKE